MNDPLGSDSAAGHGMHACVCANHCNLGIVCIHAMMEVDVTRDDAAADPSCASEGGGRRGAQCTIGDLRLRRDQQTRDGAVVATDRITRVQTLIIIIDDANREQVKFVSTGKRIRLSRMGDLRGRCSSHSPNEN